MRRRSVLEKSADELLIHATRRIEQRAAAEDVWNVNLPALVREENQLAGGFAVLLPGRQMEGRQRIARLLNETAERRTFVPGAQYSRICSGLVLVSFFHWSTQSLFYVSSRKDDSQRAS